MESFDQFKILVEDIRKEKLNGTPFTIVLTSSLSFTPAMLASLCIENVSPRQNWANLCATLRELDPMQQSRALAPLRGHDQFRSGYQALAQLIKAGYCSPIILTTNSHAVLEDVLTKAGMAHQSLVMNLSHTPFNAIRRILQNTSNAVSNSTLQALRETSKTLQFHVLKLHGDINTSTFPEYFPDCFEFTPQLQHELRVFLNDCNLLFIGSLAYDQDIRRNLSRNGKGKIYAISENGNNEKAEQELLQILLERNFDPQKHLFYLEDPNIFLMRLEQHLMPDAVPREASPAQKPIRKSVSREASPAQKPIRKSANNTLKRAEIVLATVTQAETKAILQAFQAQSGEETKNYNINGHIYHDLGSFHDARIYLVQQAGMGAAQMGGSILTLHEVVQQIRPKAVIMVGIAFGFDKKKQSFGQIIVSSEIISYESQKHATNELGEMQVIPRGHHLPASSHLLECFQAGEHSWQGANVDFGQIVSGEILVDHIESRDFIQKQAPEALAGDMEGYGLSSVGHHRRVDWIVVKAISDFGDGHKNRNKGRYQQQAASNVAAFILHVVNNIKIY